MFSDNGGPSRAEQLDLMLKYADEREQKLKAEVKRLTDINAELVKSYNALLIDGARWETRALEAEDKVEVMARRADRYLAERDGWEANANYAVRDAVFYRDLVYQIGELFGVEARTSDDGSVQDSVLALKVPELVTALVLRLKAKEL